MSTTASAVSATLTFRPLSPAVGAEVEGLDLKAPIDAATADALRAAYARHHLLLLRGQDVAPEDQARFARVFGEIAIREKNKVQSTVADTQHISNAREDGIIGLGELDFHMDQLFHKVPLSALILYGMEIPSRGGDTRFTNAAEAWRAMPDALKTRIDKLQCRHAYNYDARISKAWNMEQSTSESPTAIHPMVWTNPKTGERALWVNKMTTVDIVGMDPAEGAALMEEARRYLYDEAITYTHKWRVNDLVIWNNQVLQHARTPFDAAEKRTLRRTPIV